MSGSAEIPTELLGRDGPSHPAGLRLVATWNGGSLVRDLPESGTIVVGRGEGVDVRIEATSVSRRHLAIHLGGTLRIEDLGSANGTYVDGARLEPGVAASLAHGSLVEMGAVMLVVPPGPGRERAPSPLGDDGEGVTPKDAAMARVVALVDLVARGKLSVLIVGETGVGKDVLAARLHAHSPRAAKPFVRASLTSLEPTAVEAELFGYERDAFPGADTAKAGLLERADGGTLFIDEIADLPTAAQAKLSRVLESGEVTRLGALASRPVDVRIVSGAQHDPKAAVEAGRVRQDLYHRLDGFSIRVPPLRERLADIPVLAEAFAQSASEGRARIRIADDAMAKLVHYPWPGNVRELRNVIVRSVLACNGDELHEGDVRLEAVGSAEESAQGNISESERRRIIDALDKSAGNQTRAAKLLGISRRTLLHRLDALGLPRPRKKADEDDG